MEFTGKTLEKALIDLEKSTGKSREELVYEVAEKKIGIFKSREFVVKLIGYKESSKIKIESGEVIVKIKDTLPQITPGENVSIFVNGKEVKNSMSVKDTDEIIIIPINICSKREMNIYISDNEMEAELEVVLQPEKKFEVCDCEEDSSIIINAKCVSEVAPKEFELHEVEELLKTYKITYGIKWDNIKRIIKGGRCIVAEGKLPVEPTPDEVKYFFNTKREIKPVEVDGKVDYYNIGETEFVQVKEILAIKNVGVDGKVGYDVFGKTISPSERNTLKLLAGPGAEALDNGNKVIALIKGMPSIRNDRICVFPAHIIDGDVDIKTGNITFEGDVIVKGSVKEGLSINSGNDITVIGDVAEAHLSSSGNIVIQKNIISSTILAGDKQLNDVKAFEHLEKISNFYNDIYATFIKVKQNASHNKNIRDEQIFKILLESKFNYIKNEFSELIELTKKNGLGEDTLNMVNTSIETFKLIDASLFKFPDLLIKHKEKINDFIENYNIISCPADVTINYCQNSKITSTNDLIVNGKGCYNSDISVDNKACFIGNLGIFRGGQLFAKNYINVKESGSPAGVLTILKTSPKGIIEIKLAHPNTVICIGEQIYKVDYPVRMLKAYLEKGEIIVEKLKA